jgi:pimeloyl-ACP methyl ester carboxylesterase
MKQKTLTHASYYQTPIQTPTFRMNPKNDFILNPLSLRASEQRPTKDLSPKMQTKRLLPIGWLTLLLLMTASHSTFADGNQAVDVNIGDLLCSPPYTDLYRYAYNEPYTGSASVSAASPYGDQVAASATESSSSSENNVQFDFALNASLYHPDNGPICGADNSWAGASCFSSGYGQAGQVSDVTISVNLSGSYAIGAYSEDVAEVDLGVIDPIFFDGAYVGTTNIEVVGPFTIYCKAIASTDFDDPGVSQADASLQGSLQITVRPHQATSAVALDAKPSELGELQFPLAAVVDPALSFMSLLGQPRQGAVADGVTKILLRFGSAAPGTVTFATTGNLPGEKLTLVDSATTSAINVPTVNWRELNNYAFAIYQVPDGLPASTPTDTKTLENDFTITFTPSDGSPVTTQTIPFKLYRPPVVLVHGLWSSPKKWTDPGYDSTLACLFGQLLLPVSSSTATYTTLVNDNFDVLLADYSRTAAESFVVNQRAVWPKIGQFIENYEKQGIAITQVDVVGHSLGGILTRFLTQTSDYWVGDQNYGKGYIRRLITLGTPHTGSALAELYQNAKVESPICAFYLRQVMARIKCPVDQGAIDDLTPGSTPLRNIYATPIPCFAISCEADSDEEYFWPTVENVFRLGGLETDCDIAGYDYSSTANLVSSVFSGIANDRVVDINSQAGGLPEANVAAVTGPDHTDEPGSEEVAFDIEQVLTEARDSTDLELANGFPAVAGLSTGTPVSGSPLPQPANASSPWVSLNGPAEGQTITAGTTVSLTVNSTEVTPLSSVSLLTIGADVSTYFTTTNLPQTFSVYFPSNSQGQVTFAAICQDIYGNVSTNVVTRGMFVKTIANLTNISVEPASLVINDAGTPFAFSVWGNYDDGVARDISQGQAGTGYQLSCATNIATVDYDGNVSAWSPYPAAWLKVSNGAITTNILLNILLLPPRVFTATVTQTNSILCIQLLGLHFGGVTNLSITTAAGIDTQVAVTNVIVSQQGCVLTAQAEILPAALNGPHYFVVSTPGGTTTTAYNNSFVVGGCLHPPSNLDYWWPGDGTAADVIGQNLGALQGGVSYAPGIFGQAFSFDGSSGFLCTSLETPMPIPMTLSLWFSTLTTNGGVLAGFGSSQTGQSVGYDRLLYMDAQGELHFGIYSYGQNIVSSVSSYNDGAWHQVAATYAPSQTTNGTYVAALYVDGVYVNQVVMNNPSESFNGWWRFGEQNVGNWQYAASYYFQGMIDEPAVFGRALTPYEIADMCSVQSLGMCKPVFSLTSFTPPSVASGNVITITGTNLFAVTNVAFNGVTAQFTIVSDSIIQAVVPSNAISGPLSITANSVSLSSSNLVNVVPSVECAPTPSGLTYWWSAENTPIDSVGGNNGTLQNGPGYAPGYIGNAFNLGGSNQFVSTASQITSPDPMSLSLWFKTTSTEGGALIGFGSSQTNASVGYDRDLYMDDNGQLHFGIYSGGFNTADSLLSYNDGNWHQATATLGSIDTLNGTNDLANLYMDGVLAGSVGTVFPPQAYNGWWRIGDQTLANWPFQPSSFFFDGLIDEVAVFDRALSPQEVASIYNAGNAGMCVPPPRFGGSPLSTNGVQLQLLGLTGQGPVIIYRSTNLVNWQPIFTNPSSLGSLQFTDSWTTNTSERFYRAAEQR